MYAGWVIQEPTIRQLRYAVAVDDEGHVGRAANVCAVSQPTLSAQLQELEHRLGVPLFERGRQGAVATAEGRPVLAHARQILAAVDQLLDVARGDSGELVGRLGIGVIPTMAPYLLPALVSVVRCLHPRAEPVLREEKTESLIALVESHELDVGLLSGPVRSRTLETAELAVDPFLVALPEGSPHAGAESLPLAALNGLAMLLLDDGHCLRDQIVEACGEAGVHSLQERAASSLSTLCQMVAAGAGATLVPASAAPVEARPGSGLVVRPLQEPSAGRTVVLAWRRASPRAGHHRLLAAELRARLGPLGRRS